MTETAYGPYPGTRPFEKTDSARFFGRRAETTTLAGMWRSSRLTVLYGDTATGKTSLLQAGVIPLAEARRDEVLEPGRISFGATFPAAALPDHNPYTLALLRSWLPGESATTLAGLTISDFVQRRAERHSGSILGAIDQVEELLINSGPRRLHQRRFLSDLAETLERNPRFHLLLVVRSSALGLINDVLGQGARQHLEPLTRECAIQAITAPASTCDAIFEADAAEEMTTSLLTSRLVSREGIERYIVSGQVQPVLLQIACQRLWKKLPAGQKTITRRDVRRQGDAGPALRSYCGQVIAAVAEQHDLPTARLHSWLVRTFVTELGTRGNAYEGRTGTAALPNAIVRSLEDARILSSEQRSGSRWYQLLDDRLIEPLLEMQDEEPMAADGTEFLRAAERSLALGELDLAATYAKNSLDAAADTDLRLRARVASFSGNLAYEREKPAEAEAEYRSAAALFEAVRETRMTAYELAAAGRMQLALGQLENAVDQLQAAVRRAPHDLVLQTELGRALWQQGQSQAADAVLTSVLGIDSGHPEALRTRGEIRAYLGKAEGALDDLDRVHLNGQASTRAARGLALAKLRDHPAAEQEIKDALVEAPHNGPVLLFAAKATALGGDRGLALELAQRAVDASDPPLSSQHRDSALQMLSLLSREENGLGS